VERKPGVVGEIALVAKRAGVDHVRPQAALHGGQIDGLVADFQGALGVVIFVDTGLF